MESGTTQPMTVSSRSGRRYWFPDLPTRFQISTPPLPAPPEPPAIMDLEDRPLAQRRPASELITGDASRRRVGSVAGPSGSGASHDTRGTDLDAHLERLFQLDDHIVPYQAPTAGTPAGSSHPSTTSSVGQPAAGPPTSFGPSPPAGSMLGPLVETDAEAQPPAGAALPEGQLVPVDHPGEAPGGEPQSLLDAVSSLTDEDGPPGDAVLDDGLWAHFDEAQKALSMTASLTTPILFSGEVFDVDRVMSSPMYDHAHDALAASAGSKKKQARARKEASKTDENNYSKEFAAAKADEYKSWKQHEVFDLIDLRKHPARNFVTGRWVLTIKRDKQGNFQKCKARWVLRGFQDKQKWD